MATVFERMRAIGAAATSAADLQRAMGAFGLESDATLGPAAAEQRRAMVAARLPRPQWPDRPMIVAAVNAHTGELAAFDRDSGVDLVDAVTARHRAAWRGSHTQHQRHALYQRWRALRRKRRPRRGLCERRGALAVWRTEPGHYRQASSRVCADSPEWRTDLASQVEALRKQGSRVEVITPDADSRAAMGTNQMDLATRIPAARAGFAQGKQEATRVTFL